MSECSNPSVHASRASHSHTPHLPGCSSDILAVAFRPDGKELCASTRSGKLCFWDSASGVARGVIDGRRDAAGGRRVGDARTSKSSAAGKCFSRYALQG